MKLSLNNKIKFNLFLLLLITENIFASSGLCIHCMHGNDYPYLPYIPPTQQLQGPLNYYQPWWGQYAAQNFVNYQYPGSWYWPGLQGNHYPGSGDMIAGKPNVYMYGKSGTHIALDLELKDEGNILCSSPPLSEGWKGIIRPNGIEYLNIIYPYYYYDFRSMKGRLQSSSGFCAQNNLIDEMAKVLEELYFNEKEIHDFKNYWYFKLPLNEEYCVFPQFGEDLEKVSKLTTSPSFDYKARILFIIVPSLALLKKSDEKFRKRPEVKWMIPKIKAPQDDHLIYREWGVGFMAI